MERALIVGVGSIGRRHLKNLRSIAPDAEITVLRHSTNGIGSAPAEANRVVFSMQDALKYQPQAAIVANPAACHVEVALQLASAGVPLLVEKPLSNSLQGVRELIDVCQQSNLVLMTGYNLRFQPALQALQRLSTSRTIGRVLCLQANVGQYLPDWRPGSDYRTGVSAQANLGGGVVFELSHELDYARWLMGEVASVSAQLCKLGNLEIDVEDTAAIQLVFESGALGEIHMDMLRRDSSRTCTLIGTEGTLVWDALANQVILYESASGARRTVFVQEQANRNDMFVSELEHFLRCVTERSTPAITGYDGLRVLEIALAAHESSRLQRAVALASCQGSASLPTRS